MTTGTSAEIVTRCQCFEISAALLWCVEFQGCCHTEANKSGAERPVTLNKRSTVTYIRTPTDEDEPRFFFVALFNIDDDFDGRSFPRIGFADAIGIC